MLSGEGNENGEKTTVRLIGKIATSHEMHTFFAHFFVAVLHVYDVKLPETSQLHVLWRKMSYVFLFTFFSPAPNFPLGGRQQFSFSRHRYKIFMLFFQQKMSPFFFSRSSFLSLFFSSTFAGLSPIFSFSLSFSFSIF